jgi:nitrite reductase/ring-hydroxylating ferredoxin subunit
MKSPEDSLEDCSGDCFASASRRRFLRDSFVAAASALVAVGMGSSTAFAMPLEIIESVRRAGDNVSYAIPAADGAQIDKKNEVILVRWQNAVYAFNLSCPHQNTALKWDDRDKGFACPKHHSRFTPAGDYIEDSGRATRNMDRFAITRDATGVRVDLEKLYEADKDTAEWTAAVVKV